VASMVWDFRELFVAFGAPQVIQQIRLISNIHKMVSVRVWEEILVRCWISPCLSMLYLTGYEVVVVTKVAQEQFKNESLREGLLDLSFVCC
jgi:hypothetical protein